MSNAELACTYASLILHDDGVEITADKIQALLTAANVKIPPFWPGLFAKALKGQNLDDLILNTGGGAAPAQAAASAPGAAPAEEEKKEEKKEEKAEEESDEDMGFGLFD